MSRAYKLIHFRESLESKSTSSFFAGVSSTFSVRELEAYRLVFQFIAGYRKNQSLGLFTASYKFSSIIKSYIYAAYGNNILMKKGPKTKSSRLSGKCAKY